MVSLSNSNGSSPIPNSRWLRLRSLPTPRSPPWLLQQAPVSVLKMLQLVRIGGFGSRRDVLPYMLRLTHIPRTQSISPPIQVDSRGTIRVATASRVSSSSSSRAAMVLDTTSLAKHPTTRPPTRMANQRRRRVAMTRAATASPSSSRITRQPSSLSRNNRATASSSRGTVSSRAGNAVQCSMTAGLTATNIAGCLSGTCARAVLQPRSRPIID